MYDNLSTYKHICVKVNVLILPYFKNCKLQQLLINVNGSELGKKGRYLRDGPFDILEGGLGFFRKKFPCSDFG